MPTWLINLFVTIAIKIGVPWLIKKFPWIPSNVVDVINELIDELKKPEVSNSVAKKQAIRKVKALYQVSKPSDLVRE